MTTLTYATEADYKRINEYFEGSGIEYTESDEVIVFDDKQKALEYLMNYDASRMAYFLLNNTPSDENEPVGDFVLDNLDDVWNDYENGKIYIIG